MRFFTLSLSLICLLFTVTISAQTALQTSFETNQSYTTGNLHGQNGWTLTTGSAVVNSDKAKTGTQSVRLSAAGTSLQVNYIAYPAAATGITGEVYADMWVNPVSFVTKGIAINGYDLFGGSSKRIFVIELGTDNKVKAYNGSSAVTIGDWISGSWIRISLKLDFATEKYKVAINGAVSPAEISFREVYTTTRPNGVKEFHSLRFNHTNDTQVATSDASVDDIYIGTTPIADIAFGASSTIRTITVNQPDYGVVALNPSTTPYTVGQTVTASLTLPQGYTNNGWTGDLSGTELSKTFTVSNNMTIGANTGIDAANPPPQYSVTIAQPANGTITLSPASATGLYYKETKVTATIAYEACYQFDGWSGDLTGTQLSKQFIIQDNMIIGAAVSLNNTAPVKRTVSTVTEFKNALAAMNPGDTIEVNDGSYNLSSVTISRSGCSLRPILITAKNKGQAILNGATALVFRNMKYTTFKGFAFQSANIGTGIKLENCSRFRITENSFAISESTSCTWVYVGDTYASPDPLRSGYNRIDHNVFDGKTQAGNYIRMDGNINQQSQYDTIDHNWFKNNGPRAANEKESIRVGVSTLSKSSGFTIIEYNLFEDCDGDPEVVSIKSCYNTIRYNTFVRCLGTLCLRQGFRSVVEGNYFFGEGKTAVFNGGTIGCGGIRVYGKDHTITNNYFHGLTGSRWDAAITITNGDVTNSSASLADHYLPENLVIAFNTLVQNKSNIEIGFDNGGSYPLKPINCLLANNIVVDSTAPIVKAYSTASLGGVAFSNNIMYPTRLSSVGITASNAEIKIADPLLVQPACSGTACSQARAYQVYRLSTGSPAIDAATGNYPGVVLDFEKQARTGAKDIGADEYSSASPVTVTHGALDATQVGPDATAYSYSYNPAITLPARLLDFNLRYSNSRALLNWSTSEEINVKMYTIQWSADGIQYTGLGQVAATGNGNGAAYSFEHLQPINGRNYYRLLITDNDDRYSYSPVRFIDINAKAAITIYPNPASGSVSVAIAQPASASNIRLMNASGLVTKQWTGIAAGSTTLSLSGIPAGMYMLMIENDQQQAGYRLLITQ